MYFEWNNRKNELNIIKHGIDFVDAVQFFENSILALTDNNSGYGEERWIAIGWISSLVCVVIYTERGDDIIRIISARKATKFEVREYEKNVKN